MDTIIERSKHKGATDLNLNRLSKNVFALFASYALIWFLQKRYITSTFILSCILKVFGFATRPRGGEGEESDPNRVLGVTVGFLEANGVITL